MLRKRLRRLRYAWQIRRDRFISHEQEFERLPELIRSGDWVLDVGANVGHYTVRMSRLAGVEGRVFAFEPIPESFAVLATNLERAGCSNVTLFNVALSGHASELSMTVPLRDDGAKNFYRAKVSTKGNGADTTVFALGLDSLAFPKRISLVKIDVEEHELAVLAGMRGLLERDAPTLILESGSDAPVRELESLGYEVSRLPGSPNVIARTRD